MNYLTFVFLFQLPVGVNEGELEDRIIRHLAAAAAMGRTHHVSRREGSRNRSTGHGQPQFLVFSANPNAPSSATDPGGVEGEPVGVTSASPSVPLRSTSETANISNSQQGTSVIHRYLQKRLIFLLWVCACMKWYG